MKKLLIFPLLLLFLMGCAAPSSTASPGTSPDGVSSATESRYREGEVREYKGARLDPAIGPSDNSISGIQHVDISKYSLQIDGLVDKPVTLKYDDVKALTSYEQKITLNCVEGWQATVLWKGSLLKDIMGLAGVKDTANTVIFHAVDGYTTSLPLETVIDRGMILAYDANGLPLPPEMGYPFIVVAVDKLGYKWCRWVDQIWLSDDPNYRGYWEQNGYDNGAEVLKK